MSSARSPSTPPGSEDVPPKDPFSWPEWRGWQQTPERPYPPYGEVIDGTEAAAVFFSDFHLSDGSIGDDYLYEHLRPIQRLRPPTQLQVGTRGGKSRARYFAAVVAFTLQRLQQLNINLVDWVLDGDTVDVLEIMARGTQLSAKHNQLFGVARALLNRRHKVYYLRGNHDFIAPPGPWTKVGDTYSNQAITTVAHHGDQYDPSNWPRGLASTGSQIVTWIAPIENWFTVIRNNIGHYYYAGIDNLRPLTANSMRDFLRIRVRNRQMRNKVLPFLAFLAGLGGLNVADDTSVYRGATRRLRRGRFAGWLTVQGHTHIPIAVPGVHYNLGTWITHLTRRKARGRTVEDTFEFWPFLIVYKDPQTGARVEEYFTLNLTPRGRAVLIKRNVLGVNNLRGILGHRPPPPP